MKLQRTDGNTGTGTDPGLHLIAEAGLPEPFRNSGQAALLARAQRLAQRIRHCDRVQFGRAPRRHHAGQHVEDSAHGGQPTSNFSMTIVSASAASVHSRNAGWVCIASM